MRLAATLLLGLTALTGLAVSSAAGAAPPGAPDAPPALSAYAGRVVYLDFWASWCGPCAESFPWLNAMRAKYGERLAIVGVDVDTDAKAADAFLAKHPAQFDILRDPKGALPEHYRIEGMPSAVILDAGGHVLHQHSGFHPQKTAEYEAAIDAALAGRSP